MNFDYILNLINSLSKFEDIFTWYCCIIGLIGNTITCVLLGIKIKRLKNNYFKVNTNIQASTSNENLPTTSTSNENMTILINRNVLLEKKHNLTLYLYFIGILISDLILLLNWILSKISITINAEIKLTSDNEITQDENYSTWNKSNILENDHYLRLARYDEYRDFLKIYSIETDKNMTNFYLMNQNNIYLNKSISHTDMDSVSPYLWSYYYVSIDSFIQNFNFRKFTIKFIDLQGVCQLYYYFTIISLNGSFIYILASLLDRILKIRVINRELINRNNGDDYFNLDVRKINAPQEMRKKQNKSNSNNQIESFHKSKNYVKYASLQIKNLSSKHTEIVQQLFGKTSAIFICLFIIFFYFHLLWIYGSVKEEEWLGNYNFNLINLNEDRNLTTNTKNELFYVKSTKLSCQLLNLSNHLPLIVMGIDLFLLLILGFIKIFLIIYLIILNHHKNINQPIKIEKKSLDKKRNRYFLKNCTIYVSFFNTIFTMPSVIARNVLMIFILVSSLNINNNQTINTDQSYLNMEEKHINNKTSFFDNNSTVLNEQNHVSVNNAMDWSTYLSNLCNKFDFFLLIASSHKFLIFIFKCYLYKFKTVRDGSKKQKL